MEFDLHRPQSAEAGQAAKNDMKASSVWRIDA
jgi:hypothetical protein